LPRKEIGEGVRASSAPECGAIEGEYASGRKKKMTTNGMFLVDRFRFAGKASAAAARQMIGKNIRESEYFRNLKS
jgi:hypothetical protein